MDLTTILNYYCRKIGIWFLTLLPVILASALLLLIFTNPISKETEFVEIQILAAILYLALIIITLPFALNGLFMERAFNTEIKRIINSGLLIQGVEGFDEVQTKVKLLYRGSYSISGSVIISFLVFISASLINNKAEIAVFARFFIFFASIGLLAISSGASMVLRLPDKSAIQPGGLMKFYSPRSLTLKLDNILTDSINPRLDPITRLRMDEWSNSIIECMSSEFLSNCDSQTRLERAREKIFLLVYLNETIPELLTEHLFHSELKEIIHTEKLESFIMGKSSGISIRTVRIILRDVIKEVPRVFELVQRIFVLVSENLRLLQTQTEYITIAHPTVHIGNIDPFRITIFILNLQKMKRKVQLQVQTSMSGLDPDDASQTLLLDSNEILIPASDQSLKFSSSSDPIDVLRLVSSILQVGDAINLQFRPNRFGTHVLNISVEDDDHGVISGRSIVISVQRDLRFFVKTMGAKALGYVGAAISFIGIGLGSISGLLGQG